MSDKTRRGDEEGRRKETAMAELELYSIPTRASNHPFSSSSFPPKWKPPTTLIWIRCRLVRVGRHPRHRAACAAGILQQHLPLQDSKSLQAVPRLHHLQVPGGPLPPPPLHPRPPLPPRRRLRPLRRLPLPRRLGPHQLRRRRRSEPLRLP